jgi:hypothetical protein
MSNPNFLLNGDEAWALYSFLFKRAGYISHEFDPLIIELFRKLDTFFKTYGKEEK